MEEGNCLSCHTSHYSGIEGLLKDSDPSLCTKCHSVDTERLLNAHMLHLKEIKHCITCHESHVTEGPGLLKSLMHDPFDKGECEVCHE